MQAASDWALLADFDIVVNCAGALQDGARDDVAAVQEGAMLALYEAAAAAKLGLIVQVSARLDGPAAGLKFSGEQAARRRSAGAIRHSFRHHSPGRRHRRNAHGGSALLRGSGSHARGEPRWCMRLRRCSSLRSTMSHKRSATLSRDAFRRAAISRSPLLLKRCRSREAVALHRAWLGLPPANAIAIPELAARPVAFVADLLGYLGWRSPLRSTAMQVAARAWQTVRWPVARRPAGH